MDGLDILSNSHLSPVCQELKEQNRVLGDKSREGESAVPQLAQLHKELQDKTATLQSLHEEMEKLQVKNNVRLTEWLNLAASERQP